MFLLKFHFFNEMNNNMMDIKPIYNEKSALVLFHSITFNVWKYQAWDETHQMLSFNSIFADCKFLFSQFSDAK